MRVPGTIGSTFGALVHMDDAIIDLKKKKIKTNELK